ncbi:hypothetical protein OEZ85_007371 [Tetradesmus obliquus]|uniref:SGNH hydrolase-type esterase domain-containing protein n=1 Tax=Tetradesmus obliquus TaxID=3088 RepID=A0ABY8TXJ7_TETOB|nr:hypothetical protein OEZ85_007371 [Tetradesmus obliquus]
MMRPSLPGREYWLAQGFRGVEHPRNYEALARKLATPGSTVKVVAFGGSITQGMSDSFKRTWAHEAVGWLQEAFPSVKVTLTNLARDATDVGPAAMCWYQLMPPDTDLVLVDYSLGGCGKLQCAGIATALVGHYESFLRRAMRRAPGAAFLLLENFYFAEVTVRKWNNATASVTRYTEANPYYQTGGDMHEIFARRYRLPMVSTREGFYDLMYNDTAIMQELGVKRADIMVDDKHPNPRGHAILGRGIVAWGLRRLLREELRAWADGGRQPTPLQLPKPVSPLAAQEADADSYCAEGLALQRHVVDASVVGQGWRWKDSSNVAEACAAARAAKQPVNCDKWGAYNQGYGKSLELVVNTQRIQGAAGVLEQRRLVLFFDRATARNFRVGSSALAPAAWVQCVAGCSCEAFELGGEEGFYPSETAYGSTLVSQHPQCRVRLTIRDKGPAGNDYFKVNGVAVVPLNDTVNLTYLDRMAIDKEAMFLAAYKSWSASAAAEVHQAGLRGAAAELPAVQNVH